MKESISQGGFARRSLVVFIFAAITAIAAAQPLYDVTHTYNLHLRPGEIYRGAWAWNVYARAVGVGGTDIQTDNNTLAFTPPNGDLRQRTATVAGATANAQALYTANLDGTGFHEVRGTAAVTPPNGRIAEAQSTSRLALNVGRVDGRGRVTWHPEWHFNSVRGGAFRDPMDFHVLNLDNGLIAETRLFDMEGAFDGNTNASWVGGDLNFLGTNGTFDMNMNSPYLTSGLGTLHLAFSSGVVTQSTSTGVFAGQIPGVGQSATFTSHFGDSSGNFDMDYDFGAANTNGFNFDMAFEGNGFVKDEAVPEPSSMLGLVLGGSLVARRRKNRR